MYCSTCLFFNSPTSEFRSILAFRQQHKLRHYFDISDLYFVCRMIPLNYDIICCYDEVIKCQWMKVEELTHSKETTPLTHLVSKLLLDARVKGFNEIDIGVREIEMNIPEYAISRSYKFFMRSS